MSAAAIAELPKLDDSSVYSLDPTILGIGSCVVCGHPEDVHEVLLTSRGPYVICHERTDDGECFRVRHSLGIALGACRGEKP